MINFSKTGRIIAVRDLKLEDNSIMNLFVGSHCIISILNVPAGYNRVYDAGLEKMCQTVTNFITRNITFTFYN